MQDMRRIAINKGRLPRTVQVEITRSALNSVFDECDRYDRNETGGRLVGHYTFESNELLVQVCDVIEPGPNARRTSSSFFQDGDYQTRVFRELEQQDPTIEHLGNWHTHHVNGYPRLSQGDITTYQRIVNHELHNLDFFYALLVTKKRPGKFGLDRYTARHYLLFRGDREIHEVNPSNVRLIKETSIWSTNLSGNNRLTSEHRSRERSIPIRAQDKLVLETMYPSLKPRLSKRTRTLIWKGPLPLVDGTEAFLKVLELEQDGTIAYYPSVTPASRVTDELGDKSFNSASEAVRAVELTLNHAIYESATWRGRQWKC